MNPIKVNKDDISGFMCLLQMQVNKYDTYIFLCADTSLPSNLYASHQWRHYNHMHWYVVVHHAWSYSLEIYFDETCEFAKPEYKYLHDFARLGLSRTNYSFSSRLWCNLSMNLNLWCIYYFFDVRMIDDYGTMECIGVYGCLGEARNQSHWGQLHWSTHKIYLHTMNACRIC